MTENYTDNFSRTGTDAQVTAALAKFGARSLSDRVPFLYGLSGYDPARVRAEGVRNGGHDWLPYGWAR